MEGGDVGDCPVCCSQYDEVERRPRVLTCGHTFCCTCLASMIEMGRLLCPTCRNEHCQAAAVTDIPINYDLEELLRRARSDKAEKTTPSAPQSHALPKTISKKIKMLMENEKDSLVTLHKQSSEMEDQLHQYDQQLLNWHNDHRKLDAEIMELQKKNREAAELVATEREVVAMLKDAGQQSRQRREVILQRIDAAKSIQEAVGIIDDAEVCTVETEDWQQNCLKQCPNFEVVYASLKMREACKTDLHRASELIAGEEVCVPDCCHEAPENIPIMEKLNISLKTGAYLTNNKMIATELPSALHLLCSNLQEALLSGFLKEILKDQRVSVAAVQRSTKGCSRFSKLTLKNDHLHVQRYTDIPPAGPFIAIKHEQLETLVQELGTMTYLVLEGNNYFFNSRVYIRLLPDNTRAQQFKSLCWGQFGPTYHATRLLRVNNKRQPGESVTGGDYENNDGTGGAPLEGVHDFTEQEAPVTVGLVTAENYRNYAHFRIVTRSCEGNYYRDPLGYVEKGIQGVKTAIDLMKIYEVRVSDCGVIVPL